MSNGLTITYVPALGSHVAIQDNRVVGASPDREALIQEVGEPTATAESVFTESEDGPSIGVEELLYAPTDADEDNAVYLHQKYARATGQPLD